MSEDKIIWPIGGGKSGGGKSVVTANAGCALALAGKKVVIVDADSAGSSLHAYFGVKPPSRGLDDFLKGAELMEAAIETSVANLRLISGAGEFLGMANDNSRAMKLISGIRELDADFILVYLGAGSSYNALDLFAISGEGIVVLTPDKAAIRNAYTFLKSFVYRRLQKLFSENPSMTEMIREATDAGSPKAVKSFSDLCERIASEDRGAASYALSEVNGFRPRLVLNMASSKEDHDVAEAFMAAVKTFLGMETSFAGALHSSPLVFAASTNMRPFMLDEGAIDARRDVEEIVASLMLGTPEPVSANPAVASPGWPDVPNERDVFGFNENVSHEGAVYHVQTEAQGAKDPFIETIIYNGGRIFFSKRTQWKDAATEGLSMRDFATRQHLSAVAAVKTGRIKVQG